MHSFGPSFRVWGHFTGTRFRFKVSLHLALVPSLGCVYLPGSEPRARLLRVVLGLQTYRFTESVEAWGSQLEEVCHWGWPLRFQKSMAGPVCLSDC